VDAGLPGLLRIDPLTGDRTLVSGSGLGTGPAFSSPADIALLISTPLIATDFSCRLDLSKATLDVSTFPIALWRYMNLTSATIHNVSGATLSTKDAPLDLSKAILDGVNLSEAVLTGAVLKDASLQGTDLAYANLDGANLEGADLAALPNGTVAKLTSAFLRDASLAGANLTGVIANYASFYSSESGTATASDATMTGAKWNNACLANADFSDAVLQSTEWTQAVLVGANFHGADLSKNATAGEITDFSNAYLQGAVFTNAPVTDADFTNSYWDVFGDATLNIQLQSGNVEFTGYWGSMPECVEAAYPNSNFSSPTLPNTSASNTCPNGDPGPCDDVDSQTPLTPMGEATPAAAVSPSLPGDCTGTDIFWIVPID